MVSSLSFVLLLHSDIHLKPIGGISLCIIYTFRSTIPQLMPTTMTTMMMMNSFATHISLSWVELKVEVLSRTSISSLWAILLMRVNPLKFQDFRHSIRPIFLVYAMCCVCISKHALLIPNNGRVAEEKRDSCFFHYKYICLLKMLRYVFFTNSLSIAVIISISFLFGFSHCIEHPTSLLQPPTSS